MIPIWLFLLGLSFGASPASLTWEAVAPGLDYAAHRPSPAPAIGDGVVSILRIDPARYEFVLMSAKQTGDGPQTAPAWARRGDLIAAVNAGMYMADFATNLGYMQHYDFVNNPRLNRDNTIAAFNPKQAGLPPFQIIDRTCQDWDSLRQQYHSFTQSIRMVDCHRRNRWSQQPRQWSMVVLGEDRQGRALFIFTRSPYSVHDFIDLLLALDLDLAKAMYLEGGPEASFFLDYQGKQVKRFGSYETGFYESDENPAFWPIPNVIGIRAR